MCYPFEFMCVYLLTCEMPGFSSRSDGIRVLVHEMMCFPMNSIQIPCIYLWLYMNYMKMRGIL